MTLPQIPKLEEKLTEDQVAFLKVFAKSCRKSILEMVTNAQSGHPGGSLSSVDYLAALYAYVLGQTGEKVVISNGHISPAVYSILAEMGYIKKEEVVQNFRKFGTPYEGHISRHVPGIYYGTGPLGVGVSVASAFALAEKLQQTGKKTFCLMGDGETQEGQVHEMIHFAKHYKLGNLILFVDYNKVQLTSSIEETLDINVKKIFEAGDWHIIDVDGHDFNSIWEGLQEAHQINDKPIVILGHTIMGQGVNFMEKDGKDLNPKWHGKPPKPEESALPIKELQLSNDEENLLEEFRKTVKHTPEPAKFPKLLSKVELNTGTPIEYGTEEVTSCRNAYGKALVDLAKSNSQILALVADLKTSVMTRFVSEEVPDQHIECGIAEQHMVSLAGGLSLSGFIPFASTFGAFMSSRAKDQARVNDINYCNTKLVSTHCGLSVGEDGPTHQAIDDAGSFLGMFNTMLVEPADPNQTDRMIRYIASHYGNFYMRMGRHNIPAITKEDGTLFYDKDYKYEYGKCDLIRPGENITLVAIGSMVENALKAYEILKENNPDLSIELIAATSIKKFDDTLINSIKKTKKVLTVEDHNTFSGLASQLALYLEEKNIKIEKFKSLGVPEYQLSGKPALLYENVGLSPEKIAESLEEL